MYQCLFFDKKNYWKAVLLREMSDDKLTELFGARYTIERLISLKIWGSMMRKEVQKGRKTATINVVSKALSSIYTGVFFIDLVNDSYDIISSPKSIISMLNGITSAQKAINCAIQNTVSQDELLEVLTFVNLFNLSKRMESEKCLNIDYKGTISGWVRGSFIEAERDNTGELTQVLYVYQIIDEEKRKELEHLQQLKESYARTEKEIEMEKQSLEKDKKVLADELKYHSNLSNIVMEQLTCGVLVYTVPGRNLLQINPEALRIMGWKNIEEAAENMETNWKNVVLLEGTNEEQLLNLRTKEASIKYRFVINAGKSDERRILAESKSFSGRNNGNIIISTLMDITHVVTLEKEKNVLEGKNTLLANENVELQRARDAVYSAINAGSYLCTYAEDGETLLGIKFSDALRKLYGYTNEEDAPNTWDMWINGAHPEDREYVLNQYLAAVRDRTGKTDYSVIYRAVKKDGTVRWYKAAGYVIRRKDGTAEFCYGLISDIDEQKKASDRLEEALEQTRRANEAKTSFLARMSHDIRTPMNGIMGLIDINEKHADDIAFTAKNRKKAKVAADHLLSLINDVLQLSKLEDSNIELSEMPFNMLTLLEDIFTITEMRAKNNGITIKKNEDESVRDYPYLWGSPLHVRQIYINLLGNAIKYNKKNGSVICDVSAEKKDQMHVSVKIVIKDTGIGISKDFQQHLFDPFAREHEEIGEFEGTGLGLSIVKQLIDKMGGSIQVESEVDKGSCFTVKIPFKIASEEDVRKMEEPDEEGIIEGRSILLVEDNELNMDIAEILLTDAGANITKAANGQQAVDIFKENPPGTFDLILMDVMMPVMNGYKATKCIRSLEREDAKEIPIIAMTANAFVEDIEKARQAGMSAHLAKPVQIEKVIKTVSVYCRNSI